MGQGATQADAPGTLRGMDYVLQMKALPGAPATADPALAPDPINGGDTPARWAGDLYQDGDEPDPSTAFRAFHGADSEEAWLMQAEDGTLTGWVRDPDGSVYRYNDPEAWAVDVDDAHMTASGDAPDGAPADEGSDTAAAAPGESAAADAGPEDHGDLFKSFKKAGERKVALVFTEKE